MMVNQIKRKFYLFSTQRRKDAKEKLIFASLRLCVEKKIDILLQVNLLSAADMNGLNLRDIHLPDPVSFWPFIIFTSLIFVLGLTLLILAAIMIKRRYESNLKVQSGKMLKEIENTFYESRDAISCISELSVFLRRVVISQKKEAKIAGITGIAWLKLLDEPLKEPEFSQGIGQLLLTVPYSKQVAKEDVIKLLKLSSKWLESL